MKKILLLLSVLFGQSAFAQNIILSEIHLNVTNLHPDKYVSLCNKNKCNYYAANTQDYLVNIKTQDGKTITNKIKDETIVEATLGTLIKQEMKNIIIVSYKEKHQSGFFNDKEELDPFLANKTVSENTNYEKVFYIPVTDDKSYHVKIDDNKSIEVLLK